jgi:hypothetical protein
MRLQLLDTGTGASIELTFVNDRQGGSSGTNEREKGVAWLQAMGCQ